MKREQTLTPLRNRAWPIAAGGFMRQTGAFIATASKSVPITLRRMSIVSATPGHRLVRNGLNAGAPRAIIFLIGRLCWDKSEWAPISRILAKLRHLKNNTRQRGRPQTLL